MTMRKVWVTRRVPQIPRAVYDPTPYLFLVGPGDWLPRSAFDEWCRRGEILAALAELGPREFLVITNEVRP
jgi:hypothetical protein